MAGSTIAREEQRAPARQRPKSAQHIDTLRSERHEVISTDLFLAVEIALHPGCGNAPERHGVQVLELLPSGSADFVGAHRGQRKQA